MDHVDECSCVGYAVSNFDLPSELWENTQIQTDSSIVIIVCFYPHKLIIRSTFCMNLLWYIFEGVVVSQWSSFHCFFFSYEVEFLLSCWLRQCWSIWHVNILYCSFLFKRDWLILNQTKCSLTNTFLTNKCVLRQSICPWQCQKNILMERSGFIPTNIFAVKVLFFYI